jgi:hypothetical protein
MFHRKPTDGGKNSDPADSGVCSPRQSPLVIDPTGVWFRSEGNDGNFICGMSPFEPGSAHANPENGNYINSEGHNILTHDPDWDDVETLNKPDHGLFEEFIWPTLYERVPAFGDLKLKSAWAGFYEYNIFDQVPYDLTTADVLFLWPPVAVLCYTTKTPEPRISATTICHTEFAASAVVLERDHWSAPGHPQPHAVQRLLRPRPAASPRLRQSHRGAHHRREISDHRPEQVLVRQDSEQQAHF